MAEDLFFNKFVHSLKEAVDELGEEYSVEEFPFQEVYCSVWNNHKLSRTPSGVVIACDGSSGTVEYSGGLKTWYVRALCHISSSKGLKPIFRDIVKIGTDLGGLGTLMKSLEADTLLEAIKKAEGEPILALFDGSLYPYFSPYPDRLETEAKYAEAYAKALNQLLHLAKEGVVLVGAIKDSEVDWLRMRLLLDKLRESIPELRNIQRERNPKRILEVIDKYKSSVDDEDKAQLDKYWTAFLLPISDENLFEVLAGKPGYTCPMALAPRNLYLGEEVKAGTMDWWNSRLRNRVKGQGYTDLIDAFDELYRHEPLAMFYWRPHHGLGVYRIDVPCSLLGFAVEWGSLSEDVVIRDTKALKAVGRICDLLNGLSPEPYTIKPLLDVDEVVRMKTAVFSKVYQQVIMSELEEKRVRAYPRKRDWRDYVRRYMW